MVTETSSNKISLNVTAPSFNLKDVFGREISLESYRGKKVFLGFFRHTGCPFCNLRVHTLMKVSQELKQKGLEMIFFFESEAEIITRSSFLNEISPIPIISDPEKKWYATYGLEESFAKASLGALTNFIKTAIKASKVGAPNYFMKGNESFSTMPAEFLLDENLIIRELHYSQRLADRMSIDVVQAFME